MKPLLITLLLLLPITCFSEGLVDLSVVAKIESNNNIWAYNPKSKARGLYQITPICLEDYNGHLLHIERYKLSDLWRPEVNKRVARWYLERRIPQLLRHYKIKVTTKNVLWAYNAGIGRVIKGIMPKETKNYIKTYFKEVVK